MQVAVREAATAKGSKVLFGKWHWLLVSLSGLWVLPVWIVAAWLLSGELALTACGLLLLVLAPAPALLTARRRVARMAIERDEALERAEQANRLCETMRFRAQRLTQDLTDADRQARMAHQLTLLGQFVAGFLHEVNNPLAILTGRAEVLLVERSEDRALCRDLGEILKEARYVSKIAGTLLPALAQAKADSPFEPARLDEVLRQAVSALKPGAKAQGVDLLFEGGEPARVNLPPHVVEEVARVLVNNALQALEGSRGTCIRVCVKPGGPARSTACFSVEDDGPGVPEELRSHLFEPFVSRSSGRQRSGLGLFIVASLLKVYDGSIRYEPGERGGARFSVELPRARFTREQPYHWFVPADPFDKEAR